MDNNGKINRGIDLGTTNSTIAVMENGVSVIKKSDTQKDTIPSIVSITRKGIIHTGDTAANELANQMLRATKTWDGRTASTDIFKEFKRTMGTVETYRSKNLRKNFTSQQLSAEIIKALAANAGVNDGGCIVISVPAKFDAIQKTATVEWKPPVWPDSSTSSCYRNPSPQPLPTESQPVRRMGSGSSSTWAVAPSMRHCSV